MKVRRHSHSSLVPESDVSPFFFAEPLAQQGREKEKERKRERGWVSGPQKSGKAKVLKLNIVTN